MVNSMNSSFKSDIEELSKQSITRQNWTQYPGIRSSFQRVQQFTQTTRIPRSANFTELPKEEQDLSQISFTNANEEHLTVGDMLERTYTDGFLAMHRSVVVSEKYYNGMYEDTLHLAMSCSKSMTSTIIGILKEKGLIDLSKDIIHYCPEFRDTALAGASVQQILDMRVGVKYSEDYHDPEADVFANEVAGGWRDPEPGEIASGNLIQYIQTLRENNGNHGGTFHYQSILTDALGLCAERASGQGFDELLRDFLWQPMGAEHDMNSIVDSKGLLSCQGGFNCCLRDFARFGYLIQKGGIVNGRQIVPRAWIESCRFPDESLVQAFSDSDYGELFPGGAYHNQWWVKDPENGVLMALGVHGQTIYIDTKREIVIAKFSSQPDMVDSALFLEQIYGMEAIANNLSGAEKR